MFKYITFSIILIGLIYGNLESWHKPIFGVALTVIYLLYYGKRLGVLVLPSFNHFWQKLFGPLFLLAGWIILGSLVYYFYALPNWIIMALVAAIPLGIIPYCQLFKKKIDKWEGGHLEAVPLIEPNTRPANRWAWLVLLGDGYLFYYLFTHATVEATRSPWLFVDFQFFLIFFILTFFLIIFIRRTESTVISFFTIFVHSSLLLSVALIIYQLGYGFDPFIHRATEKYISDFGSITPKTPYYLGQYALVVIISKITALSIGLVDKILLPLLEAMILPPLFFLTLRHGFQMERQSARLGSLLFFLIPFSSFIATTPNDLAIFFAIALVFFGALLITTELIPWSVPLILILAVLAVHPLIGLPMLAFYLLLMSLSNFKLLATYKELKFGLPAIIFILGASLLPAVFIIFLKAEFHWPNLSQIWNLFAPPSFPQLRPKEPFSIWFALIYYYNYILPILTLAAGAFGGWLIWKNKKQTTVVLFALAWLALWVDIIFLKLTTLQSIINYEQTDYANRLAHFSFYLIMPLFLLGLISFINYLNKKIPTIFVYTGLALLIAVSFYLSYPRVDNYAFSKSFNVSQNDFDAVRQIDAKANDADYIVLSHQIFSAAALQEYGFKKYYQTPAGEIFYYALPTGDIMYEYFQKMVYGQADRATMNAAMDLVGVKQAFLVLHDYWNSFATAAPQAKASADEWWAVDNGKILVFWYKR
ncbi:MAG: hypothetical protein HZC05_01975 [Candidatus Magasanikbacteria bacterium]|nr:hypothetical protein [Candidatus Magasanikbacteria bacterium]